jgi:hypothetical protein
MEVIKMSKNFIGTAIVVITIPILIIIIKEIKDTLHFKKLLEDKLGKKIRIKDIK